MKRLFILCALALLMSCVCLPQLPTQTIYVDSTCSVVLPDYRQLVTALDNCDLVSLEQDPEPGTVLNYSGILDVTMTASDISGNVTEASFEVLMVDTIPPEIIIDSNQAMINVFDYLDAFQATLKPYISDSIWATHNLVMISSPDGTHMGGWYESQYSMITVTDEDLETLGYRTYKIYLE